MNERKREELAFRHQPYLDSPEGVLANYIKNNFVRLLKEEATILRSSFVESIKLSGT